VGEGRENEKTEYKSGNGEEKPAREKPESSPGRPAGKELGGANKPQKKNHPTHTRHQKKKKKKNKKKGARKRESRESGGKNTSSAEGGKSDQRKLKTRRGEPTRLRHRKRPPKKRSREDGQQERRQFRRAPKDTGRLISGGAGTGGDRLADLQQRVKQKKLERSGDGGRSHHRSEEREGSSGSRRTRGRDSGEPEKIQPNQQREQGKGKK